jgi:hypothetical protein
MNKSSFGSTMFSFLLAFALLWEASGHMHDVITGLASTPDGKMLFVRSRFWLLRSEDKGNSWTPLRNPENVRWELEPGGSPNFLLSPDFKNDTTLLFGRHLSTDAGEIWSINLEEKLTRRKWLGIQYQICKKDVNPFAFSANFANDKTIFAVACQQENPKLATLLYSTDLGKTFDNVSGLSAFKFKSWTPIFTTTTDEIYLQRIVGSDTEIFTPTSSDSTVWKRIFTLKKFEIQNIREDHSSDGLFVIERKSQTLYRLSLDADENEKLVPMTLPSATTANSGDQLLISAYSHIGVGTNTSLFVLRSTCPGRSSRLRQLGANCPRPFIDEADESQTDYVLLSRDEGTTWKNQTVNDWFCMQGGGTSANFGDEEFTFVVGIPGTPTVFLGTFTGLYRSEDHGESWEELDTIAKDITGMNAAIISPGNIQLSLCTYDESCWYGDIDVGQLRNGSISRLPEGFLKKVIRSAEEFEADDPKLENFLYSTIAFSDGVGFLSDKIGVMRYGNGFNATYSKVESIPTGIPTPIPVNIVGSRKICVQGIAFSPNFENDKIMFITGWNVGVYRSVDRGLNFEKVFDPTTEPQVPDGSDTVGLVVSPDFASTGVVFTYVTDGTKLKEDSLLFISEDFGISWTAVDQGEDTDTPPRMQSLTFVIDNDDNRTGMYSLLGNEANGNIWVNRRNGETNKFGEWEPLQYFVKGEFTSDLPKTSVARQGFGHESVLGTPDGKLYMGILTGGVSHGKLVGTRFSDPKASGLSQRFRFGGLGQRFNKAGRRTYFEALIKIEGVLFGAYSSEIWMSLDDGSTWTSIYNLAPREPRFSGCKEAVVEMS